MRLLSPCVILNNNIRNDVIISCSGVIYGMDLPPLPLPLPLLPLGAKYRKSIVHTSPELSQLELRRKCSFKNFCNNLFSLLQNLSKKLKFFWQNYFLFHPYLLYRTLHFSNVSCFFPFYCEMMQILQVYVAPGLVHGCS